jgi:LacI family transcriptional regulator
MTMHKTSSLPTPSGGRVTISDIARIFDVSAMTVSKALNRKPGVSPDKANAIRSYAQSIGYRPSHAARSLLKGRTHTVGICIREGERAKPWGYPWLYGLMREIGLELQPYNMHAQTCLAPGGAKECRKAIEHFMEIGVESLIIGPLGALEEYHQLADILHYCPHVLAFDAVDDLPIDHVKWNTYKGGQLLAEHLAELGHKKLMVLGVSERELKNPNLHVQLNGLLDTAKYLGIQIDPQHLVQLFQVEDIPRVLKEIYSGKNAPSAVFCHNDWVAMHAIQSLTQMGLRVPEDVSVTGFDDLPVAGITTPALTSVGYDIKTYARKITQIVVDRVNDRFDDADTDKHPLPSIIRWELEPQLHIRNSTALSPTSASRRSR